MILQLKMTLKNIGVPVWRRIQIDENSTFQELHKVIQVTFDWTNSHLHNFLIWRSNGQRIESVYIEMENGEKEDPFPPFDFLGGRRFTENRSEEKERLSEWLKQEKDRIIYTYDFGDDWEHEIVLEKILDPEPGLSYPICIKAKNDVPFEDSRFEVIQDCSFLVNPDWKEIVLDINEQLSNLDEWSDTDFFL